MGLSKLEICNRALGFIGVAPVVYSSGQTIANTTVAGRILETQWLGALKIVSADWSWARYIFREALTSSTSSSLAGWAYQATTQSEFYEILRIINKNGDMTPYYAQEVSYGNALEMVSQNRYTIYTGETNCFVEGIKQWVPDTSPTTNTSFNDDMNEALSFRLAADIATALTGAVDVSNAMLQRYQQIVQMAMQKAKRQEMVWRNAKNYSNESKTLELPGSYMAARSQ